MVIHLSTIHYEIDLLGLSIISQCKYPPSLFSQHPSVLLFKGLVNKVSYCHIQSPNHIYRDILRSREQELTSDTKRQAEESFQGEEKTDRRQSPEPTQSLPCVRLHSPEPAPAKGVKVKPKKRNLKKLSTFLPSSSDGKKRRMRNNG